MRTKLWKKLQQNKEQTSMNYEQSLEEKADSSEVKGLPENMLGLLKKQELSQEMHHLPYRVAT